MAGIINARIDLSKIDTAKITEKDGKKWLSISIVINNEADTYDNNVSLSISQSKEERENKVPKNYIGNGKVVWTDGKISKPEKF